MTAETEDVALDFLRRWPTAVKHVTTIDVDARTSEKAGHTEARAFVAPYDWSAIGKYIADHQAEHLNSQGKLVRSNVYFTVNELIRPLMKKAAKTDVSQVVAFYVDIDLDGGNEGEAAVRRLDQIVERLSTHVPKPTAVVRSGGGAQGFWMLREDERLAIDGDTTKASEAERYTRGLQEDFTASGFKADATHNVDRIMRVPGTTNIPSADKVAKGRRIAIAELIYFDESLQYALSDFRQASNNAGGSFKKRDDDATNGPPLDPDDPTDERVFTPSKYKVLDYYDPIDEDDSLLTALDQPTILLGRDGDVGGRYLDPFGRPDRSRALFAFATECKRLGIEDDVIARVIMDKRWRIGECVRDKGAERKRQLRRTIERANEAAFDADLAFFNGEYAVIRDMGGRSCILHERNDDPDGEDFVTFASFESFINGFMNQKKVVGNDKKGNPVRMAKTKWWLNSKYCRVYTDVRFMPGAEAVNYYNLWRGFAVESDCIEPERKCALFLEHVKRNVCRGIPELYDYVVKWMARGVQLPDKPGGVALVLRGRKGTGKGEFARHYGRLFGRHYVPVNKPEHVTGKFNAHMGECIVMFADECFYPGNPQHEQILKNLVTETTWMIERKGIDAFKSRSRLRIIISGNETWSVPSDSDERRYCCILMGDEHRMDAAYFIAIDEQMRNGGYEALLGFLQGVDLTGFNPESFPMTDEQREQAELTLMARDHVATMIQEACHEGFLPFSVEQHPSVIITSGKEENSGFDNWVDSKSSGRLHGIGSLKIKRDLQKRWACKGWRGVVNGIRMRGIEFPSLGELRATFAKRCGRQDWRMPEIAEWEPRPEGKRMVGWTGAERQASGDPRTTAPDHVPF